MTNDEGAPARRSGGAPMNRMMPDTYEKRGMTTAHLRQTLAAREARPASKPAADKAPDGSTLKPKAE